MEYPTRYTICAHACCTVFDTYLRWKGKVPDCWQRAEGIFVPKEKDSKHVSQFRTISLLNVEGKIYFAILAKRLTTYLMVNQYIDTSVQKRRSTRIPWVCGTHQCYQPVNKGGESEPSRSDGCMA